MFHLGVQHASELMYQFGIRETFWSHFADETKLDANDGRITSLFCTLLTNFAKYG